MRRHRHQQRAAPAVRSLCCRRAHGRPFWQGKDAPYDWLHQLKTGLLSLSRCVLHQALYNSKLEQTKELLKQSKVPELPACLVD